MYEDFWFSPSKKKWHRSSQLPLLWGWLPEPPDWLLSSSFPRPLHKYPVLLLQRKRECQTSWSPQYFGYPFVASDPSPIVSRFERTSSCYLICSLFHVRVSGWERNPGGYISKTYKKLFSRSGIGCSFSSFCHILEWWTERQYETKRPAKCFSMSEYCVWGFLNSVNICLSHKASSDWVQKQNAKIKSHYY